ncbi:MAG TPA: CheR family methyltransferase [Oligoflexia bacterium]|nr:CheR family methyltransferase [Oligoflexia bacterium]
MNNGDFRKFRDLIYQESGIALSDDKVPLLKGRIAKRLRVLGLSDERDYLRYITDAEHAEEVVQLIDAVSTNVTFFYREPKHFEFFALLLKRWEEERKKSIRIWCAAASSGEEPYTLSIVCRETLGESPIDARILATDISTKVLKKAAQGEYRDEQFRETPSWIQRKYFKKIGENGSACWSVAPEIRDAVLFRRLNLSKFPYPLRGSLDAIFCRNVMIYFSREMRQRVIGELERLLVPGGYLFLSHSENLLGINTRLETVKVSVYRKPLCS